MNDLTVPAPRPDNSTGSRSRAPNDPHEAAGQALGSNWAAVLREREQLRERIELLLTEQGALLARIAEMVRANDQKDKREAASQQREAELHSKTSHLAATVEIVRDALEKALTAHKTP